MIPTLKVRSSSVGRGGKHVIWLTVSVSLDRFHSHQDLFMFLIIVKKTNEEIWVISVQK